METLHHRRRAPPSPLISPVVLILIIPILSLLLLYILLPPFITHTSKILKPSYSVKKSWDSLNIFLVVFAILCGFLAKRNDNDEVHASATGDQNEPVVLSGGVAENSFQDGSTSSTNHWFDRGGNNEPVLLPETVPETRTNRLRRSSSSYPDLRRDDLEETGEFRFRFFDDFELDMNMYRNNQKPENNIIPPAPRRRVVEKEEPEMIKVIPVDTFEVRSSAPPPENSNTPPSPPPPPPEIQQQVPARNKRRRSVQSVPRRRKSEKKTVKNEEMLDEIRPEPVEEPAPPPPPPPPPPEAKIVKLHRRKSGTKEIATAIASFYNQTKRKRKPKNRNIYENVSQSPPPADEHEAESMFPPPTPPPPPPPLPPKVFQNFFKKSTKNKRVHSVSTSAPPPPPPPPPPPHSIFNNIFKSNTKSKRFNFNPHSKSNAWSNSAPPPPPPPSILNNIFKTGTKSRRFKSGTPTSNNESPRRRSGRPPLPTKSSNYQMDDNIQSAAQSPLHSFPPPPPPPPFKMRAAMFVAKGDFVRIRSADSSRCSSPGLEDVDVVSVKSLDQMEEDESIPSIICPSPDVNVKADNFIARLKDEWRTEIMNSRREKRKVA